MSTCKIGDVGKIKYEQSKKQKKSSKIQTKQIKLSPRIGKHDLDIKVNKTKEWLDDNFRVYVSIIFKGRENTHKELGYEILKSFEIENVKISQPKLEGNNLSITLEKN